MTTETGWLLDNGSLCIGVACGGFGTVTYTDELAIRFARKQDAENFLRGLTSMLGKEYIGDRFQPVIHGWFSLGPDTIEAPTQEESSGTR